MDDEKKALLLGSIDANRLVMLAGAGLSMGAPTNLPKAAALAESCARQYEESTGVDLPSEAHWNLESLAAILYDRNQLRSYLIGRLVDWRPFQDNNPNAAHRAVADLLLCSGLEAVVSTNYDTHIESAAKSLGEGDFQAGIDGDQVRGNGGRYKPLLKLHGCCVQNRENTVWLQKQLDEKEIGQRIKRSKIWARAELRNRDLLLVGFWSDWAYLNSVLHDVLDVVDSDERRHVFLVDPAPQEDLEAKAPRLWRWATESKKIKFHHIREKGEEFLDDLRLEVSKKFLRQAWGRAAESYRSLTGAEPGARPDCSQFTDTTLLYQLRRDMTGAGTNGPVGTLQVDNLDVVAAIQRRLLDLGATLVGCVFHLGDQSFRVVFTPGKLMSQVKHLYGASLDSPAAVDRMVCVGAVREPTPANITRPDRNASIIRPRVANEWVTVEEIDHVLRGAS